tara:strand:- start:72 stop:437 length:366 start_codon:yes stop_codon:yes gene_type:complete
MEECMISVLNNFFKPRIVKAISQSQTSIDVTINDFLEVLEKARIPIYLEGWERFHKEVRQGNDLGWYHAYFFQIPFKWKSFMNKNGIVVECDSLVLDEPMIVSKQSHGVFDRGPILTFSWV